MEFISSLKSAFLAFRWIYGGVLSFLIVFLGVTESIAAQELIPFERGHKWGYINDKGAVVIGPQFEEAAPFSEGLARVMVYEDRSFKEGFIDKTGRFIIRPRECSSFDFSEGLAAVRCGSEWGYIDHSGKFVIPARFSWAGPFSEGMAEVQLPSNSNNAGSTKFGFIDKTGNLVIQPKFEWTESFSNGLAVVAESKRTEPFIDKRRNRLLEYERKFFIDKKGEQVTQYFEDAASFKEGLASVRQGELWGFIDISGAMVIPPSFDEVVSGFSEGFAAVRCTNGKYDLVDRNGRSLSACSFERVLSFREGLAAVVTRDKRFGFVDATGELIIELKDELRSGYVESFEHGIARVGYLKNNWVYEGFIDRQGTYVAKPIKKKKYHGPVDSKGSKPLIDVNTVLR